LGLVAGTHAPKGPTTTLADGTTEALLARIRSGDSRAHDEIVRRYLPKLQRWARGRLPSWARDLADTDDLVQQTFLRALANLERFENGEPGSFLSYLRSILQNQVRDQVRRVARRPFAGELPESMAAPEDSPLEQLIGRGRLEAYERALARLTPEQRAAVMMRIELDFSWEEVARSIGSPSPGAARMLVARAVERLAEEMDA
jgi:RNA polymerase sigma-70 factor (ECF subfamily)